MQPIPLRTTVVGSYSMPAWLELSAASLDRFGTAEIVELQDDACVVAVADQVRAGLDVITDGEQGRFDFNLSFYGHLSGIEMESAPPRR
jgi:5-methyltetrahydropteroyltriglutamate--homocysteine methyltransferase